jgi:hypothetical protein
LHIYIEKYGYKDRLFFCKRDGDGWFIIKTLGVFYGHTKEYLFVEWELISYQKPERWKQEYKIGIDYGNWFYRTFKNMKKPIISEITDDESLRKVILEVL